MIFLPLSALAFCFCFLFLFSSCMYRATAAPSSYPPLARIYNCVVLGFVQGLESGERRTERGMDEWRGPKAEGGRRWRYKRGVTTRS
jgi:hypothetical protein